MEERSCLSLIPIDAEMSVHCASLIDPRRCKIKRSPISFLVIGICAVIWGADDFVAIADFGCQKRKWLE